MFKQGCMQKLNQFFFMLRCITVMLTAIFAFNLSSCHDAAHHRYQGYIEGRNTYLASPYSGKLIKAWVVRGERVKKGQLLFQLDPEPQMMEIKQANAALAQSRQMLDDLKKPRRPAEIAAIEAQVGQADAQLHLAKLRVKRHEILYAKHVLDKDTLDASVERVRETEYLKSQFEANLALSKLGSRENLIKAQVAQIILLTSKRNQSKWELSQKKLFAPTEGVIFDTYFKIGEFVDSQRAVASVLSPENIQIIFFIPEKELHLLQVGQSITFDCDGCSKANPAKIEYISPEAEYVPPLVYSRDNSDHLVFRIRASISKAANFKPGQPVMVDVATHD